MISSSDQSHSQNQDIPDGEDERLPPPPVGYYRREISRVVLRTFVIWFLLIACYTLFRHFGEYHTRTFIESIFEAQTAMLVVGCVLAIAFALFMLGATFDMLDKQPLRRIMPFLHLPLSESITHSVGSTDGPFGEPGSLNDQINNPAYSYLPHNIWHSD